MLRFFAILIISFSYSFGCEGGFSSCIAKIKETQVIQRDSLYIPVSKTQTLIYSKKHIPNSIKHDPFLSLYLVNKKSKYFFKLNKNLKLKQAVVNEKIAQEIKIKENQFGLNKLASLNQAAFAPSLFLNTCSFIEGIVTPEGIIEKEYIENFLKNKEIEYGDIGIRLEKYKNDCIVIAKDPFIIPNPLKVGDKIVSFDNKKMTCHKINQAILFSKINTTHKIGLKADKEFSVIVRKRYGGGAISDTFLESRGIYLDNSLKVIKLNDNAKQYGISPTDVILGANGTKVKTERELQIALSSSKDGVSLLLQRAGFQFFVQIY